MLVGRGGYGIFPGPDQSIGLSQRAGDEAGCQAKPNRSHASEHCEEPVPVEAAESDQGNCRNHGHSSHSPADSHVLPHEISPIHLCQSQLCRISRIHVPGRKPDVRSLRKESAGVAHGERYREREAQKGNS